MHGSEWQKMGSLEAYLDALERAAGSSTPATEEPSVAHAGARPCCGQRAQMKVITTNSVIQVRRLHPLAVLRPEMPLLRLQ